MARVTIAYGGVGPWAGRRGYDTLIQAVTGFALADSDDGRPRLMPVQALDYLAGGILAVGICAALRRRSQEGGRGSSAPPWPAWRAGSPISARWHGTTGRARGRISPPPN